jgi:hypothetical protein
MNVTGIGCTSLDEMTSKNSEISNNLGGFLKNHQIFISLKNSLIFVLIPLVCWM